MNPNARNTNSSDTAHVQGVDATRGGLIKATIGAALVAGAILTFIWLPADIWIPAEYGIDPTGVGYKLGLKDMGHIKNKLHIEADKDAAAQAAARASTASTTNADINRRLDQIQAQLDAIAKKVGVSLPVGTQQAAPSTDAKNSTAIANNQDTPNSWLHENEYTLEPGQGFEVKLVMEDAAIAEYEWTANGAVVNHDTHADGNNGESISYEKGRSVPGKKGRLVAAFAGQHGWYWKNRNNAAVVIKLRTRGAYSGIVIP